MEIFRERQKMSKETNEPFLFKGMQQQTPHENYETIMEGGYDRFVWLVQTKDQVYVFDTYMSMKNLCHVLNIKEKGHMYPILTIHTP